MVGIAKHCCCTLGVSIPMAAYSDYTHVGTSLLRGRPSLNVVVLVQIVEIASGTHTPRGRTNLSGRPLANASETSTMGGYMGLTLTHHGGQPRC